MRDARAAADGGSGWELPRRLGLFSVTNIVIANMIGAGIFTTSGLLMKDLGDPRVMLVLWVVGAGLALCGALSYGELGAAIPRAGGEYVFLSRLFHPLVGFLSGWVSFFVGFTAPVAASAIGFSNYLTRAFPILLGPEKGLGPFDAALLEKLYAVAAILGFTLIHMRGMRLGARVQNALTVLKIGLVVVLILAGLMFGGGDVAHFSQGRPFRFDFAGWKTLALSLMWIMFAYSGWNASAYIGSEIREPVHNLPRSLLLGTGAVAVLYFGLNLVYVYAVPPEEMSGVVAIGGLAVGRLFGSRLEVTVSVLIAFALFSSLSAFIILGPRVYYSMARDGHFFAFARQIHPRFQVPHKSILLQGVIASIMVFLGTFDQILTYMGFSLGIFPLLAVSGVFLLRRRGLLVFRAPGFPLAPLIYIAFSVTILVLSLLERPLESGIAIATVLAGVPVYSAFRCSRSKGVSSSSPGREM